MSRKTSLPCSGDVDFGDMFTSQHFVNVDFLTRVILNE